jgi:aminoglycoside 3-N-acetyltransferase
MNLRNIANIIPKRYRFRLKLKINLIRSILQAKLVPKKTPEDFKQFLIRKLNLKENCDVLVHSSYDALIYWNLSPKQIIKIILEVIGDGGTLIMPSFSSTNSKEFIDSNRPFDVLKTPTQMGLINEVFRKMPSVIRSFDPLKSFAAFGPKASYYTNTHHLSKYSYDKESPLFKLSENNGIIIGLGVPVHNLTIVHTIENIMDNKFPIEVYDNNYYDLNVLNYDSDQIIVRKKILKEKRPNINIEKYSKFFNPNDFYKFSHYLSPYFYCFAKPFLKHGIELAEKGITVYR